MAHQKEIKKRYAEMEGKMLQKERELDLIAARAFA